ncbi:MAG: PhoU domain-containing protein [Chloroflexota bacterium]
MGSMVEKAILHAVNALKERDLAAAKQIIADDAKVDRERFEIEEKCIHLIATQQPMASDLRTIICVLNIITDLERIGDYAGGIAKVAVMNDEEPPLKPLIDIPRMAEKKTSAPLVRLMIPSTTISRAAIRESNTFISTSLAALIDDEPEPAKSRP